MPDAVQLAHKTITGRAGDGPHLLITAGVHGDEFEPMAAVRRLIHTLDAQHLSGRVTLVPVVNEPAFRRGARTAEDGLDLARTCPGRPDGSATERVADALTQFIRSANYYIDLHTGGTLLEIVPLAGYTLHREQRVLDAHRRMARAFNLPLVWGTTPTLQGRSLSVARDADVPAIYVEHGGGAGCDPAKIEDLVAGCRNVMAELGMLRRHTPSISHVRHVVEDNREQSGHLQINHPAPASGFFEPAVTLGQMIESGQPLGELVDPLGEMPVSVAASHSGIVAVLRTFRAVNKGDSLGTVVELRQAEAGAR
ncbi:MAG TPA: succinylglutamate desuccinylase/aspartoacylase family protein [Tepidisphaeraceae bacterium]|nr:succinylglutamate desuccinylase/aspartoacylase family protein [Tepidisphaeraceae bacterium]